MTTLQPSTGGAPEKQVVSDIILYLQLNGWRVLQIEQQWKMRAGTADLLAGKSGRAVWIEAKRRGGKWRDRLGRSCTLREGQQKPKQRQFELGWTGTLPYIIARSWEDVASALRRLGLD